MTQLQISSLTVGYHYPSAAVQDLSLNVESGQIVAFIGPNGAGKSTSLNAISGLLRPWSGTIALDGQILTGRRPAAILKAGVAQVPEGRRILPGLTVAENLAMGAYIVGKQRARVALARVLDLFPDLAKRLTRIGGTLSGGEQQMLAIGRALMSDPKILALDEPSMGLAPQIVERIFEHIVALRGEGLGILLVEQNANIALETSDYAYVIERGRIILEGPSSQCAADPQVQRSYLGV